MSVIASDVQLCFRLNYATCNGWLSVSNFQQTVIMDLELAVDLMVLGKGT